MDFFEKYRYQKDNPEEFGIDLKKIKRPQVLDESHLSNLLSHSIKVTKDILPTVQKSIDEVFKKLKIENQFNFFITSDNYPVAGGDDPLRRQTSPASTVAKPSQPASGITLIAAGRSSGQAVAASATVPPVIAAAATRLFMKHVFAIGGSLWMWAGPSQAP